ncbi:MAG: M15 family metallopeptidase [Patescibacteria group bacterium]|nr:M15 family metallopeptidase [Patescibacteria group bacterium]
MQIPRKLDKYIIGALVVLTVLFIAGIVFFFIRTDSLQNDIADLRNYSKELTNTLASTTASLNEQLAYTHTSLSNAISEERNNVGTLQNQLGGFQNQFGNLSGTVTTLQKLSQTDPELLKKYSKVYFLNENYVPSRLSEIPLTYQYSDRKQLLLQSDVLPRLEDMVNAASSTGVKLYVFSAYRSFDEQKALKGIYTVNYGAGTANSFSADQGYSEHQLGTAVDMITPGLGGQLDGFDNTNAYTWMLANAYKYGFVISYPKNNGYYVFEPWHWRFVGVKLATDLHNQGKNFYDMDQRDIDKYLANIFD